MYRVQASRVAQHYLFDGPPLKIQIWTPPPAGTISSGATHHGMCSKWEVWSKRRNAATMASATVVFDFTDPSPMTLPAGGKDFQCRFVLPAGEPLRIPQQQSLTLLFFSLPSCECQDEMYFSEGATGPRPGWVGVFPSEAFEYNQWRVPRRIWLGTL